MKSINIKLLLPDAAYDLVVERSSAEGVGLAHYCSSLLIESLGSGPIKAPIKSAFEGNDRTHNGAHSSLPDTVEQILAICNLVWRKKMDFADALRKVANDLGIQETTVRDKCTRRISLPHAPIDTERFLDLLARPNALRDCLCHRFPKFSQEIANRLDGITSEASS